MYFRIVVRVIWGVELLPVREKPVHTAPHIHTGQQANYLGIFKSK